MYYLYILKNTAGRHYIGISKDVENRLASHNRGKVTSTRPYRPWIIVYRERFLNRVAARHREIRLKSSYDERRKLFESVG